MNSVLRCALAIALGCTLAAPAFAQWSNDPAKNLALADKANSNDQVQPKLRPMANNGWYVSWFDSDPSSPPPVGYDVYYQRLDKAGYEKLPHNGLLVADLTNSSTEDYGLDFDTSGNALLAFLDTREGLNQQVTAAKMSPTGRPVWGPLGVQLTSGSDFFAAPKIVGASDGGVVVGWTDNSNVVLQKLDPSGHALWGSGIVLSETGYNYSLSDLHAADNGSVIVSWTRDNGFGSNRYLYANKLGPTGFLMWGSGHVHVLDSGSLQFGNFPYFVPDGKGGAVFAWYTSSPSLQSFAQHILASGAEAYPHNGAEASTNGKQIRVSPAASYRKATDEVFLFWTEEDSNQTKNGVYGQKFNSAGTRQWGDHGLVVVPLGADSQIFVQNVQSGMGALTAWVDQPANGNGTIQAVKLDGSGNILCAQFPISSVLSSKSRLAADIAKSGVAAIAFEDARSGNNGIYIQNVNPDCSLGNK